MRFIEGTKKLLLIFILGQFLHILGILPPLWFPSFVTDKSDSEPVENDLDREINSCDFDVNVRKGKSSDCKDVARMIQELANFQSMPNGPQIDAKALEIDGFGRIPPLFQLFVAETSPKTPEQGEREIVGYALYYNKYSTWKGKAMVLEDLYCVPKCRGRKIGSELFKAVIREALATGCRQMDFEVLEWNPARNFYEKFGAVDITQQEQWHLYRMSKEILETAIGKI